MCNIAAMEMNVDSFVSGRSEVEDKNGTSSDLTNPPQRVLKRQVSVSLPDLSCYMDNLCQEYLDFDGLVDTTMDFDNSVYLGSGGGANEGGGGKHPVNGPQTDHTSFDQIAEEPAMVANFEQALDELAATSSTPALETPFGAAGSDFEATLDAAAKRAGEPDTVATATRLMESGNVDLQGIDVAKLLMPDTDGDIAFPRVDGGLAVLAMPASNPDLFDIDFMNASASTTTKAKTHKRLSFSDFTERMVSRQNGYLTPTGKQQRQGRPRRHSQSSSQTSIRRWDSVPNMRGSRKGRRASDPGYSLSSVALMMLPLRSRVFPTSFFKEPSGNKDLYSSLLTCREMAPSECLSTEPDVTQLFKLFEVVDTGEASKATRDACLTPTSMKGNHVTQRGKDGNAPDDSNITTSTDGRQTTTSGTDPSPRGILSPTIFTKQAMSALTSMEVKSTTVRVPSLNTS